MDALRIILLIIGIVVVAAIYLAGKAAQARRRRAQDMHDLLHAPITDEDDIPELPPSAAVRVGRADPELDRQLERLAGLVAEHRPAGTEAERGASSHSSGPSEVAEAEEFIVVFNIMAPSGRRFAGPDIIGALRSAGFSHGAMNIFHLYADDAGDAQPLLSVANAVEPGTFDPDAMAEFTSPGLTLFMRLPGPLEDREAFERMLAVARQLAEQLHGELCDQSRSVLTAQTISHLKEQIEAFHFKTQMARVRRQRN